MAKLAENKKLKKLVSEWLDKHYEQDKEVAKHYTHPLKQWLESEHQIEPS